MAARRGASPGHGGVDLRQQSLLGKRSLREAGLLDLPDDVLVRLIRILCEPGIPLYDTTPRLSETSGGGGSTSRSSRGGSDDSAARRRGGHTSDAAPNSGLLIRVVNERLLAAAAAAAPFAGTCRRVRTLWRAPFARLAICVRPGDRSERRLASVVASLAHGLRELHINGHCNYPFRALFLALGRCSALELLVVDCDGDWAPDRAAVEWFLRARRRSLRVLRIREPEHAGYPLEGAWNTSLQEDGVVCSADGRVLNTQRRSIIGTSLIGSEDRQHGGHQPGRRSSSSPPQVGIQGGSPDPPREVSGTTVGDIFSRGVVDAGMQSLQEVDIPLHFVSNQDAYNLWRTLGPGVRSLSLVAQSCQSRIGFDMDSITVLCSACPNITHIAFGLGTWTDPRELEGREALLATICRAFSDSLISVSMVGILLNDSFARRLRSRVRYPRLQRIALINCRWKSPATARSVLTKLGPLVHKFTESRAHQRGIGPLMRDHCPNLDELDIRTDTDWAIRGFRLDAYLGAKLKKFSYHGFVPFEHVVQGVHPQCRLESLSLSCVRELTPQCLAAFLSGAGGSIRRLDLSGQSVSNLCALFRVVQGRCRDLEHFDAPLFHLINDQRDEGPSLDALHEVDEAQTQEGAHVVPVSEHDFNDALKEFRRACPLAYVSDDRARVRHESGEIDSPSKKGIARTMFATFLGTEVAGPHV